MPTGCITNSPLLSSTALRLQALIGTPLLTRCFEGQAEVLDKEYMICTTQGVHPQMQAVLVSVMMFVIGFLCRPDKWWQMVSPR